MKSAATTAWLVARVLGGAAASIWGLCLFAWIAEPWTELFTDPAAGIFVGIGLLFTHAWALERGLHTGAADGRRATAWQLARRFNVIHPEDYGRSPDLDEVLKRAPTAQCPGTAAAPAAAPGYLCVYEVSQGNRRNPPAVLNSQFGTAGGADRFGALVTVLNLGPGSFGSTGTWAVTLP